MANSVVTFLSKLGGLLAKGAAIATGVWPIVSQLFGSNAAVKHGGDVVINDLNKIAGVVVTAETLLQTPGNGAAKLAAAAPLVAQIIKTSEVLAGHTIANEALFTEGCTDVTSGMAKILNSLNPDTAKTAPHA